MKHEYKQGDDIELFINDQWHDATYISKYYDDHLIECGKGFLIRNESVFRPCKKRWRANEKEKYFYLDENFQITSNKEFFRNGDNQKYECGNYFKSGHDACLAVELIKQTLKNFHDEITK